jgi:hypothetical protein
VKLFSVGRLPSTFKVSRSTSLLSRDYKHCHATNLFESNKVFAMWRFVLESSPRLCSNSLILTASMADMSVIITGSAACLAQNNEIFAACNRLYKKRGPTNIPRSKLSHCATCTQSPKIFVILSSKPEKQKVIAENASAEYGPMWGFEIPSGNRSVVGLGETSVVCCSRLLLIERASLALPLSAGSDMFIFGRCF